MTATKLLLPRFALLATITVSGWGSDFSFFTTMRAGSIFAPWELGAGSTSATTQSRTDYLWNTGAAGQNFQIGYRQATGRGFVTVVDPTSGTDYTASFANAGAPLSASVEWTLPVASFFTTATSTFGASSVNVTGLSFLSGVQILSGSLPSSIGATYSGSGPAVTANSSAPIVFNASSSGGDWTITGNVRFTAAFGVGLLTDGDQLRFGFGASGTDTPETSSAFLIGSGLIALGCFRQRRLAQRARNIAAQS